VESQFTVLQNAARIYRSGIGPQMGDLPPLVSLAIHRSMGIEAKVMHCRLVRRPRDG
jgi:hypothetical protein